MADFQKNGQKKKRGVAAIEFALIFPVLFLMLYGLITYSLIFAIQHSLSLAAAEGGRAAVRFVTKNDSLNDRSRAACAAAQQSLAWMVQLGIANHCPPVGNSGVGINVVASACPAGLSSAARCLDVSVVYAYGAQPLIPILFPVPARLTGRAFTQVALTY